MRRAAALAAGLILLALPAAASETLEIVDLDVSGYPQVEITVAVPASLQGLELGADAFTVVEEGYAVDAGVWTWEEDPISVVMVLDTSGSMSGEPIADARAAATAFIDLLPDGTGVAVVSSGGGATIHSRLEGGIAGARDAIAALEAGGETALYDAVVAGAALIDPGSARPVIVLLSDGGDTMSRASIDDAAAALANRDSDLFVIGLETDETDGEALSHLAWAGDGRMIPIEDAALLGEAFDGIADDLSGRYRLVYLSRRHGASSLVVAVRNGDVWASVTTSVDLPSLTGPAEEPVERPVAVPGDGIVTPIPTAAPQPGLLARPWIKPVGIGSAIAGAAALMALAVAGRRGERGPAGSPSWHRLGFVRRLTRRAEDVTEKVIQTRRPGRLERDLDRAGLALRPSEFVLLSISGGVAAVAGSLLLLSPPLALGVAGIAVAAPRLALRALTARRRAAFADQFDGTLQMLSGSLRAGYGLMQAVGTIAEEAPSPTGGEFARVSVENRLGRTVEESLAALAERMDNEDLRWVVEAIDIQYEVGGDLAEVLDTVAETIRDRDQIRRQVKALSAEGRISAVVLVSMPFALAMLISMVSPEYLSELTGTMLGRFMIAGALVMIGFGAVWIRRIVKVVF